MIILQTERLNLRTISLDDAEFIVELLNDPTFLQFVGDKGVKTVEDAQRYILAGPVESYRRHGFGLWLAELKDSRIPVGICGLLKRESLGDVDIGFAFLPQYRARGYAFESGTAVMDHAKNVLGLSRIVAIVNADNAGSIKVLEKLGLSFDRVTRLSDDGPQVRLLAWGA